MKDNEGNHQEVSTDPGTVYVCPNRGEIAIRANAIETTVHCEIEHFNETNGKERTHIYPNQQVKIHIVPQDYDVSLLHNASMFQMQPTPPPLNQYQMGMYANRNRNFDITFKQFLDVMAKMYCLREYNFNCNESSECRMSPSDSIERAQISEPNNSSQSSSKKVDQEEDSGRRQSKSLPLDRLEKLFYSIENVDKKSDPGDDKKGLQG